MPVSYTHLDRLKNHSDSAGAKVLSENSDVVRIMTIHKSKGLEFPVVFLSACHARLNTSDSRGSLLLHRRLGLGTDFVDSERKIRYPLISKTAVAERIRMENLSEEMRVLYVAVTRAKEKLICTAAVKNAAEKCEVWKENSALSAPLPRHFTARASSYLDWISACLNDRWAVKRIPAVQVGREMRTVQEAAAPKPVQAGAVDVVERLEYRYPYDTATRLPTKFSVSELKRRYDFEDVTSVKLYTPALMEKPGFLQEKGSSAVQAGVVNHLLLKELPRKSLTPQEVLEFADRLKERGLLKEEELSCINSSGIAGFFNSPLGERFVRANKAYRELQFNLPVSGQALFSAVGLEKETVLVQGIIDCMFEENEGLILIDFKTDRYLRPEAKEMYRVQLNIYARAAQALTGVRVTEKYLYLLAGQGALRMD